MRLFLLTIVFLILFGCVHKRPQAEIASLEADIARIDASIAQTQANINAYNSSSTPDADKEAKILGAKAEISSYQSQKHELEIKKQELQSELDEQIKEEQVKEEERLKEEERKKSKP